jgi:hypothetical protein
VHIRKEEETMFRKRYGRSPKAVSPEQGDPLLHSLVGEAEMPAQHDASPPHNGWHA